MAKVDAVIAGAAHSTADVLRAGIKILGTKNGLVSSFMLMEKDNGLLPLLIALLCQSHLLNN